MPAVVWGEVANSRRRRRRWIDAGVLICNSYHDDDSPRRDTRRKTSPRSPSRDARRTAVLVAMRREKFARRSNAPDSAGRRPTPASSPDRGDLGSAARA
ncbi:MAG: hypothetical protein JNL96_19510 [Planctomycetaceae bacterium]|nr:hypothetical protein [Planctomycetaceae bacterium]